MLIIQTILICILLTAIVKIAVGNDAVNGAYFYPKEIQQRLIELGRTDQKTIDRKRKLCMTFFLCGIARSHAVDHRMVEWSVGFPHGIFAGTFISGGHELVRWIYHRQALGGMQ